MAKLKCILKTRHDPYFKLGPIKVEEMHQNPHIWLYHDVLSPRESQDIMSTAGPFVSKLLLANAHQ